METIKSYKTINPVYVTFLGFSEVFDCVNNNKLIEMNLPSKFVKLI